MNKYNCIVFELSNGQRVIELHKLRCYKIDVYNYAFEQNSYITKIYNSYDEELCDYKIEHDF